MVCKKNSHAKAQRTAKQKTRAQTLHVYIRKEIKRSCTTNRRHVRRRVSPLRSSDHRLDRQLFRAYRRPAGARASRARRIKGATTSVATGKRRVDGSDLRRRRSLDRPRAHALESSVVLRLLCYINFRAGNFR